MGEWSVISKTENFVPKNIDHVRYTYGAGCARKLTDIFGNIVKVISEEEAEKYPDYSPTGNFWVIKKIENALSQKDK